MNQISIDLIKILPPILSRLQIHFKKNIYERDGRVRFEMHDEIGQR